jgi:hypothetical protein
MLASLPSGIIMTPLTNADAPFNKAQGNCVEEFTSKLNQHELHSNCEDDDGDKYPIRKKATENVDL